MEGSGTALLSATTISQKTAIGGGGVIQLYGDLAGFDDCTLSDNTATTTYTLFDSDLTVDYGTDTLTLTDGGISGLTHYFSRLAVSDVEL